MLKLLLICGLIFAQCQDSGLEIENPISNNEIEEKESLGGKIGEQIQETSPQEELAGEMVETQDEENQEPSEVYLDEMNEPTNTAEDSRMVEAAEIQPEKPQPEIKVQEKKKKFKTPKIFKKLKNLFKKKKEEKKTSRLANAVKISRKKKEEKKLEKKYKKMMKKYKKDAKKYKKMQKKQRQKSREPQWDDFDIEASGYDIWEPEPLEESFFRKPAFQKPVFQKPRLFERFPEPSFDMDFDIDLDDIFQPKIPRISRLSAPRFHQMPMLGRQFSRNGYPVEFEMKLEKENSQPAHGYVRSVKYVDGRPVIKEKRIDSIDMDKAQKALPIIFDPYTNPLEGQEGQRKLLDSLDNMFGINEQHKLFENTNDMILGMDKKSSENPETKGKKNSIPCEYRTSCEECTVDFSCYYCSSKKQCMPAKHFGFDSFTGAHCPASDIYYFETCRVKSFVFMFFLIISVLVVLFAVCILGFSLIWRRTRKAKIYNIIKEKEDAMDSEGKNLQFID